MSAEQWTRIKEVFNAALEREPGSREAFLRESCGDDIDLLRAVQSMLNADSETDRFLDPPPLGIGYEFICEAAHAGALGEMVGPYRLVQAIAAGGMGSVYRAVRADGQYEKQVAIKIVRPTSATADVFSRFVRERQTLAALDHPNIAKLIDGGVTSSGLHAHQHLVVHRDLKPSNILVTGDGTPILVDFGIAKLLAQADVIGDRTETAQRFLTPHYASPEQIRGGSISTATDVYSLGVVLFELLTGHRPFRQEGTDRQDFVRLVCDTDPEPPSTAILRVAELPSSNSTTTRVTLESVSQSRSTSPDKLRRDLRGDLDTIVLKAMHKDPKRRYLSVEQLGDDVHRYLAGRPVLAQRDTWHYRAGKFMRRRKGMVAVSTVAVLALIAGTAGTSVGLVRAKEALRISRSQTEQAIIQTRKADGIGQFLESILANADPHLSGGDPSVTDVLDAAASKLQTEHVEFPEVQAAISRVLGMSYRGLGRLDKAEQFLEEAVRVCRSMPTQTIELGNSLSALSELRFDQGKMVEAESLAKEGIEIHRQLLGHHNAKVAACLSNIGIFQLLQGKFQEARSSVEESLRMNQLLFGPNSLEVAETSSSLGGMLRDLGQLDDAEAHLQKTFKIYAEFFPPDHLKNANAMHNLGAVLSDQGQHKEAISLLERAVKIRRTVLGDSHPKTQTSVSLLGTVLFAEGDLAEAEATAGTALEMARQIWGEDHYRVAMALNNVAIILRLKGETIKAEAIYRDVIVMETKLNGELHPNVARALSSLAILLHETDRLDEAEELSSRALAIQRQVLPTDHPDLASSYLSRGELLSDLGRHVEAEPLLREGLRIHYLTRPGFEADGSHGKGALGECLTRLGRYEEAEPLLLESFKSISMPDEKEGAIDRLVKLYKAWGKPDKEGEYRALLVQSSAKALEP